MSEFIEKISEEYDLDLLPIRSSSGNPKELEYAIDASRFYDVEEVIEFANENKLHPEVLVKPRSKRYWSFFAKTSGVIDVENMIPLSDDTFHIQCCEYDCIEHLLENFGVDIDSLEEDELEYYTEVWDALELLDDDELIETNSDLEEIRVQPKQTMKYKNDSKEYVVALREIKDDNE